MGFFLLRNGGTVLMIHGGGVKEATFHYNSLTVCKFLLVIASKELCFLSELKISWKVVFTAHRMKDLSQIVKSSILKK